MQDAVVKDAKLLTWHELMGPAEQDAPADVLAVPDIMAVLSSSAATLTGVGDSFTCILTLLRSQTLSPIINKAMPDHESARDGKVRCLARLPTACT